MMFKQNATKSKRTKAALAALLLASSYTAGASAYDYVQPVADPLSHEFRASHPFRVYVDLEQGRNRIGRGHGHEAADSFVRSHMQNLLPGNIVLVSRRRDADMLVRAQLTNYDLSFHITDVDRRNKKYKKRYRYTPGPCGHHKRAFYTRVTEKGVAQAGYQLSFRMRGESDYFDRVQINAADSYRYGENLQALTNCGVRPSVNYPNSTVARLFTQAGGHYRDVLAQEIQTNGLRKLAYVLAGKVRARSDQFYVSLADQYLHGQNPRGRFSDGSDIYDFDHVDRPARRQPAFSRFGIDW